MRFSVEKILGPNLFMQGPRIVIQNIIEDEKLYQKRKDVSYNRAENASTGRYVRVASNLLDQ